MSERSKYAATQGAEQYITWCMSWFANSHVICMIIHHPPMSNLISEGTMDTVSKKECKLLIFKEKRIALTTPHILVMPKYCDLSQ